LKIKMVECLLTINAQDLRSDKHQFSPNGGHVQLVAYPVAVGAAAFEPLLHEPPAAFLATHHQV